MKTKEQNYNAGLIKSLFRCAWGILFLLGFYFSWFWACFDLSSAIVGTLSLFLLGPTLVFGLLILIRLLRSRRYRWQESDDLSQIYLARILEAPGPQLRLWVEKSSTDPNILWIENPFFRKSVQDVFVTEAWVNLPEAHKTESFFETWNEIRSLTRGLRILRSVQLCLWVGWLWPLELLFQILRIFQNFLGMRDLPYLSFWVQRLCNSFLHSWVFRNEQSPELIFLQQRSSENISYLPPQIWNSLLWGPWFKYCSKSVHPIWNFWGFQVSTENHGKGPRF